MKYEVEGTNLKIIQPMEISDSVNFVQTLLNHKITTIDLQCRISTIFIYFIKKYTKISISNWPLDMVSIFEKIKIEKPIKIKEKLSYKKDWIMRILAIFNFKPNNGLQDKFWTRIFLSMSKKVLLENILIVLFLFFGIGISISFLLYYEFMKYGIQMESCRVALYSGVKILCPMFTGLAIMAKSCTSLSVIINQMSNSGDFKTLKLMGLPSNQVFLNPLFFCLLISGPILNLFAILALIVGCIFSWVLNGNSYQLFLSILWLELCWDYIIESSVRASFASLVYSLATCIGGMGARTSSDSSIRSINICVIIATLGNIIGQILVTIAVTRD